MRDERWSRTALWLGGAQAVVMVSAIVVAVLVVRREMQSVKLRDTHNLERVIMLLLKAVLGALVGFFGAVICTPESWP